MTPKRANNRPLAALIAEIEPLVGSMLMFTKRVGNETGESLRRDMAAMRGYVLEMGRLLAKYDALARRGGALPAIVRMADRLDAAGAHAMADVMDAAASMLRSAQQTPQQQLAQQEQQRAQLGQLADRLLGIHTEMLNATRVFSNPLTIPSGMKRLLDQVKELGFATNALKQQLAQMGTTTPTPSTTAAAIGELVALADRLDTAGRHTEADLADRAARIIRRFSEEEKPPFKPGWKSSLSTRYCPDHLGVQATRIAERTYQCPIDGRVYDYESGYTDYNGQRVPGGSIANQTPSTMPYQLPQRLYDSRQNVLNTIN